MSDKKGTLSATIDGFIEAVNKTQGMFVKELGVGIEINVKTQNEEFFIVMLNPGEGKVRVRGSEPFAEPTECVLSGSTFGGSAIKSRWIGIGMYIEFFKEGRHITTSSPVRSIGLVMPKSSNETAN